MSIYPDTSFVVSVYLRDRHASIAMQRMATRQTVWLTPFNLAEWTHAIERHVFQNLISRELAESIYKDFENHLSVGVWLEVDLPSAAFGTCSELARRYVARLGGRTLDTLHVACALELKAEAFWTFDERQARLARAVGLSTA